MASAQQAVLPPTLQERFDVVGPLGRGTFGRVLEVNCRDGGEPRALKLIEIQGDGERERREIEASLRFEHPHLVRCFQGGVEGNLAWLLMEKAEGSLADVLKDPERRQEGWNLVRQAARGVAVLHRRGVIHRDLKPSNVLLVAGAARVSDLGLVRDQNLRTLTLTGMILGTPVFMSPEQARGDRLTPASDTYALGVMAYYALEGRLPYPALDPGEMLIRLARAEELLPARCLSELGPGGAEALAAALHPDPAARPPDAGAWSDQLGDLTPDAHAVREETQLVTSGRARLSNQVSTPELRARTRAGERWARRQRWAVGATLMGFLALGVLLPSPRPEPPSPSPSTGSSPAPATPVSGPRLTFGATEAELKEELESFRSLYSIGDGRVLDIDQIDELTPEVRARSEPLVEEGHGVDPAAWGALLERAPALASFYTWLAEGGKPEELSAADREALERLDVLYLERCDLRPFAPYLGARPETETLVATPYQRPYAADLSPARIEGTGWLGAAIRARQQVPHLELDLEQVLSSRLTFAFKVQLNNREIRRAYHHEVREAAEAQQRMLYCLMRSLREEPAAREQVKVVGPWWATWVGDLWYGGLSTLPVEALLGGPGQDPDSAAVEASVLETLISVRGKLGRDPAPLLPPLREALDRALSPLEADASPDTVISRGLMACAAVLHFVRSPFGDVATVARLVPEELEHLDRYPPLLRLLTCVCKAWALYGERAGLDVASIREVLATLDSLLAGLPGDVPEFVEARRHRDEVRKRLEQSPTADH